MIMEADRPVSRRELANVIFMGESVKPEQLSVVLASRTRGSDPQEFIEGPLFPGSAHGNSQPDEVVCWFWDYAQAPGAAAPVPRRLQDRAFFRAAAEGRGIPVF